MTQSRILLVFMMSIMLSACDGGWSGPRYQLITATDGKVYRLDAQNGAVHYVTSEKMLALNDELPTLHVGEYYQMSDANGNARYLKYLGNARFEKSQLSTQVSP
ncbi:hypothetical protein H8L32_10165 [Undibacterium sp. CY18W]|uniref:Lipoprotein n=1 Tax=Undibacterium hunanense TaxID=2762292 RepID=A0ABR6ZPN7_9BURK|nr:hypothetical protein [Undibacterium hunanense]MBC3917837.1 hypothetical protein [Undibacterium hunanense]